MQPRQYYNRGRNDFHHFVKQDNSSRSNHQRWKGNRIVPYEGYNPELAEYFRNEKNFTNCIYVRFPFKGFGDEELRNYIVEMCEKTISINHQTLKITKCHVRSQEQDAFVQFAPHMGLTVIGQIISVLRNDGGLPRVEQWWEGLSEEFSQYYNQQEPKSEASAWGAGLPPELTTSQANMRNRANDSGAWMQQEMTRLEQQIKSLQDENRKLAQKNRSSASSENEAKDEMKRLKKENERLEQKLSFSSALVKKKTKDKDEKLTQKLNRVEEENAGLKERLRELKERLRISEQARREAEIAQSSLQEQNKQLNHDLYQAKQDLKAARDEKDQANEAMQNFRVRQHQERAEQRVPIKEELFEAKRKRARLEQQTRAVIVKKETAMARQDNMGEASSTHVKKESAKVKKETLKTEIHVKKG